MPMPCNSTLSLPVLSKFAGAVIAVSLAANVIALAYGEHQRAERYKGEAEQAQQEAAQAQAASRSKDRILELYRKQGAKNREQLAELQAGIHSVNDKLAASRRNLKALEAENAALKAWADTRLPAAVISLRQRPALLGAAAYQQWLPQRNALPPASELASDE